MMRKKKNLNLLHCLNHPEEYNKSVTHVPWQKCNLSPYLYKSKDGKQCNEQGMLEIDHVRPWALGGKNEIDNLRILCAVHNKWRSNKTFGVNFERKTL